MADLIAARRAAGHGVVQIAASATLAAAAAELDAVGLPFQVVPGAV
ncbi:hypothetical protein ACFSSF_16100 [Dietzia aerolata]